MPVTVEQLKRLANSRWAAMKALERERDELREKLDAAREHIEKLETLLAKIDAANKEVLRVCNRQ